MMRILMICDHPLEIGGVSNYTRPLFAALRERGLDVTILCTSASLGRYSCFKRSGIRRYEDRIYEYVNCPIYLTNPTRPDHDLEHEGMEREIGKFLDNNAFDIAHIHSMVGMPVSLYRLLKQKGLKVLTTVHEYWWLCPYRVMVDFNNRICDGPEDLSKCAYCADCQPRLKSDRYRTSVLKFKNSFPHIHAWMFKWYRRFKPLPPAGNVHLAFQDHAVPAAYSSDTLPRLKTRLKASIEGLNLCDVVIGVSEDVRRILVKYGVEPSRILVQHIGSSIAEKVIEHTKPVDPSFISFGFIGGVGFYKGVHQMVEAYTQLPSDLKKRSCLEIYGKYNEEYRQAILASYVKDAGDMERIRFHGRFLPADLPSICNTVDLSILPSLCADTAPQTIFESFNAGLPIIAPRVGGFPDFVVDGQNGWTYEAGSVADLSRAMAHVLTHPDEIECFRKGIPPTKTMKANAEELDRLYQSLI